MYDKLVHQRWSRLLTALFGTFLSAVGINLFVVPLGLYSGGLLGLCQVIRTLLAQVGITAGFDLSGALYFVVNIPLMILAWRSFGKGFLGKLIFCVAANSLFLSIIPIPTTPIIADRLTGCLLGGICCGFAYGLILTCGGATGGLDIVGLYMSKRGRSTVGRLCIIFNVILYAGCALLFDLPTALYSAIYAVLSSVFTDLLHQQNIAVQVLVFTRDHRDELQRFIIDDLGRSVTYWRGIGGYSEKEMQVLCVCLNKYEVATLRRETEQIDPGAFLIINEGVHTHGNFERHL